METVIRTRKLTKYYGKARGIVEVNMDVREGEIFGFIGPNGAGKSTTIRTLLALIHKTSGEASIFGLDCEKDKKKILEDVGYLPGEVFYYDNMRAMDLFRYSASFYKKDCTEKIKRLTETLEVDLDKKIEDMSLGNKKKVGIVQGLLHSPKLIILDEPTSGLDPLMQRRFFDLIRQENQNGATVLFSSHILSEVQRICDRVAIIREGRIVDTRRIGDMTADTYKKVSYTLLGGQAAEDPKLSGAANVEVHGDSVNLLFRGDCRALVARLNALPLSNVDIADPSLEEIFLHYYGDDAAL